eukprot:CFRG2549T1
MWYTNVASYAQKLMTPALRVGRRNYFVERKIEELGFNLVASNPKGNYVSCSQVGSMVYLSGHIPYTAGGEGDLIVGKVGDTMTQEEAYNAAKMCAIGCLGTLKTQIGNLDKVESFVKVGGMVNCTPDFTQHPAVINGVSDLLCELYGERGKHTRVAAGFNSLPLGVPVEVDMIVLLEGQNIEESNTKNSLARSLTPNNSIGKDDWNCPNCGVTNPKHKSSCERCYFSPSSATQAILKKANSTEMRVGDWICPGCSFHNFSRNTFCKVCQEPK